MSNLKLLGAMFVFKGLELHNRSQEALWPGAQNAAREPWRTRSTPGCALRSHAAPRNLLQMKLHSEPLAVYDNTVAELSLDRVIIVYVFYNTLNQRRELFCAVAINII